MSRSLFALLCVSVWINYMDRGNLSVAAPVLQPEMGLSPTQMGILFSGFFWTYSLLQPLSGWLVDRFDVYRLYAAGFAVWSLAVAAGGLSNGFVFLFATRLVLGAGESMAYPAYSRILAGNFPEGRRGLANAMLDVGTKAGPALGTVLGAMFIQAGGWRGFFVVMGMLSLLWIFPWMRSIPPAALPGKAHPRSQHAEVLRTTAAWITFAGLFGFNYAYYFLLTWLPSYLVTERKFSMTAMAIYGSLPFCVSAGASLLSGVWTDRQVRRGAGPDVRRRIATAGLLLSAVMLTLSAAAPAWIAMPLLMLAFGGVGLFSGNVWAITQTLAGPGKAGSWTGLQNAFGNVGGVVAPILTGWLVGRNGRFSSAFTVASMMLVLSAVCYGVLLRSISAPLPAVATHER